MSLDEEALEQAVNGGSISHDKWAAMVEPILDRLDQIVQNVFPMPKTPPRSLEPNSSAQSLSQQTDTNTTAPESSNKENDAPNELQGPPQPQTTTTSPSHIQSSSQTSDSLPPQLALLLGSIRSSIQTSFMQKPPHTIQRFSELILRPTAHYRTLPAYLRAVDRVISVTSDADIFPFTTPANTNTQPNGFVQPSNSAGAYLAPDYAHSLGSDESLGGALLTPIPWLTNASFTAESVDPLEDEDPVPTEAQNLEIGDVPITVGDSMPEVPSGDNAATAGSPPVDSAEELPHARGPALLGVEDMGLQDGHGVEMTLDEQGPQSAGKDATSNSESQDAPPLAQEETKTTDKDGDIDLEGGQSQTEGGKGDDKTATESTNALEK